MLRISSTDPILQMSLKQTNILSRQFFMLTNSSSLKKSNSKNHTHLPMHIQKRIHHCNHISKQNKLEPQIITLNNHINKQIHKHKTNTWKQHLDKIGHKHNQHCVWDTMAKLSHKNLSTQ